MSALKSVQRAAGLLERGNVELAMEALREAEAALEAVTAPDREVPLDNYSHSVVALAGFDTGEEDYRSQARVIVTGDNDDLLPQPAAQVLVEALEFDHARSENGLPTDGAYIEVRADDGHPTSFEFTLRTPEQADAACAAIGGARMLCWGPPPPGDIVGRT